MNKFLFLNKSYLDDTDILIYLDDQKKMIEKIISNFSFISNQERNYLFNISKEKWLEYLNYRYQFKNNAKLKTILNIPIHILIEPSSICNLKCKMCWQSNLDFVSDKNYMGMMSLKLFKKCIDQSVEYGIKALTIASRGEPTLNPDLHKMLDYCKGKFLEIKINTNATNLNEQIIHSILKNNINLLVFSVDTYNKEDYLKCRGKNKFNIVVKNIELFHKIREKNYPKSNTISRAYAILFDKNLNCNKFNDFWKSKCDEVLIGPCDPKHYLYENETNKKVKNICSFIFDRMYIWFDGTCNPCDADYMSKLEMGNINKNTIKEIWNSQKYINFRNLHINNKRNEIYPCERCYTTA